MDEKRMDLFPLPNVDTKEVIQKSRELIKDGYDMRAYSQCKECLKQFEWDMAELDATPEFCPICFKDKDQNQLSILSGLGNGTFDLVSPRNIGTVDLPTGLASADFNSDGKLDLITISSSTNEYKIYLGTRLPTSFTGQTPVSLTANPNALGNGLVVGDFNNDRKADVIALDAAENRVQMLLGN
jgi:hypothetical protein